MIWIKNGNFHIVNNNGNIGHGIGSNRSVAYLNTDPQSCIAAIKLIGFNNGSFVIKVNFKVSDRLSREADRLSQAALNALAEVGLRPPVVECDVLKEIELQTNNKQLIGVFLRGLEGVDKSVYELIDTFKHDLEIEFTPNYQIPVWTKNGNFHIVNNSGNIGYGIGSNRSAAYLNTDPQSCIAAIKLIGFNNGSFVIKVNFKVSDRLSLEADRLSQAVLNALAEVGLRPLVVECDILNEIELQTNNKQLIGVFLRVLEGVDSSIYELIPMLSYDLNILFLSKQYASFVEAIENRKWREARLLLVGADLKALDQNFTVVNVIKTILSFEIEVIEEFFKQLNFNDPETANFKCPITLELILDPVFIDACGEPKQGYNRKDLLTWLKQSSTSPMTRKEGISLNKVLTHADLANEICRYVQTKMAQLKTCHQAKNPGLLWKSDNQLTERTNLHRPPFL